MSYIGRQNLGGAYRQLDDISSGFDGSDTTHTMQVNSQNVTVGDVNQIILSLGGVIQKPGTDFTVSGSVLTFTTAPAANTSFFAVLLGSDNGGTVTPTDGSVTGDKVASTGAFTIGATGTASSLAGIPFYRADNSIYTHDVSGTDSTAEQNTAYGIGALDAVTTGDKNTAIGYNAGTALTEGTGYNVFVGWTAGSANTTGDFNTVLGAAALIAATTSDNNIAIGPNAIQSSDTEAHNLAIGRDALNVVNSGGEYNIAIGNYSLDALTSGDYNTTLGYNAGSALTTGLRNVIIGSNAADAMVEGSSNVIIGDEAVGGGVFTGTKLVAIGRNAGHDVTSASNTTFVGYEAGKDITSGPRNVVLGANCLDNCDTEGDNIAIGNDTLHGSISGAEYNVGIGVQALEVLTSGDRNICIGRQAGDEITSGDGNILIGYDSTQGNVTTHTGNVSIGDQNSHNGGNYEITIGYQIAGLGGNSVTIGSPSGKVYNVFSSNNTWTQTSDERAKNIIGTNTVGLDFINECRVVDFTWKPNNELPTTFNEHREENYKDTTTVCNGFIAQEVKSALEKVGVDPEKYGVWDEQLDGVQSVSREMFILPLVNAVKELSAKVKALEEA